ncbi:MAG: hypothetical protein LBL31_01370 [Spirochaetaceae bacterium]|jgi:hypothetical protein|nr:hypothetical protein [Spirochaetaceae bacterium]
MAKIGIKLADGKFHPILDEYGSYGKRLVLTTASDGQSSAQIDFYRSSENVEEPMRYIGSLVVDRLPRKDAGEASIVLRVRSTGDGRIFAEAFDANGAGGTDGTQKLEIDIAPFYETEYDTDDLHIYEEQDAVMRIATLRRSNPLVPIVIGALALLAAVTVFWFVFRGFSLDFLYAQPPVREEAAFSLPPAWDGRADIPETALPSNPPVQDGRATVPEAAFSLPPVQDSRADVPEAAPPGAANSRDAGHASLPPESGTAVPNAFSRKALRTEFER